MTIRIQRLTDNKFLKSIEFDVWVNNIMNAEEFSKTEADYIKTILYTTYTKEQIKEFSVGWKPNQTNQDLLNRLGRGVSKDSKDLNFLISDHLPLMVPQITQRYWDDSVWAGDQGNTPQCVGYAWAHWIEDGPVLHAGSHPVVNPTTIYREAQKVDEWPGENYDGTSVRGGAKYLKTAGKISSYLWAFDLTTMINTILTTGPVVVGTNWYYNMFFPDKNGVIKLSGRLAGGHAYDVNGVDTVKQQFRIKNSWGKSWGKDGHAFISFTDMARLIKESGEVCLATELQF
jgi:hypothetical protein